MDAGRFDRIVRALAIASTRRGILRILRALPSAGLLAAVLGDEMEGAKRRKRREPAHHRDHLSAAKKHKKKKKKKCKPQTAAQTCAGKCGSVLNNCKLRVDCGSCACDPPCVACQHCNAATGVCQSDSDQLGDACGQPGQFCQDDGACACDASSCAACQSCQPTGLCSATCDGIGCCNGATCQPGTANDACGTNGETCQICSNATPVCVNGACAACSEANPCPAGQFCAGGACLPCDVCASDCPFASVQDAINDAGTLDGDTIVICPGIYSPPISVNKSITLVGAGNGEAAASNTILDAAGNGRVMLINEHVTATLQDLRITGGTYGDQGAGIYHQGVMLTMIDCTVSGNTSSNGNSGGGFYVATGCALHLTGCTVSDNTAGDGGGIYNDGGSVTLDDTDVSGNHPNNCAPAGSVAGCNEG
jgi:hypothetical protein